MLVIRLTKMGRKGQRQFRISVKERRSKRDGTSVETLGWFEKTTSGTKQDLKKERYAYWVKQGAIPSKTVKQIFEGK